MAARMPGETAKEFLLRSRREKREQAQAQQQAPARPHAPLLTYWEARRRERWGQ